MTPWLLAAGTALAIASAWLVHTRAIAWLPEDRPNVMRKQHKGPVPLIGVIPASVSILYCVVLDLPWLATGCALAALTGWLDDRTKDDSDGIHWRLKATGLGPTAICGACHVASVTDIGWPWIVMSVAVVFCGTNSVNFLDNTNGVAASLGALALAWCGAPELAVIWLAFLPFNWPHARLFLGDAGALALGALVAPLALVAAAEGDSIDIGNAVAPIAVFVIDFTQVVTARIALGYAPWVADRRHVTHIAGNLGVPAPARAPLLVAVAWAAHLALTG